MMAAPQMMISARIGLIPGTRRRSSSGIAHSISTTCLNCSLVSTSSRCRCRLWNFNTLISARFSIVPELPKARSNLFVLDVLYGAHSQVAHVLLEQGITLGWDGASLIGQEK